MSVSKHTDHIAVGLIAGAALVWLAWGLLEPFSVTTSDDDDDGDPTGIEAALQNITSAGLPSLPALSADWFSDAAQSLADFNAEFGITSIPSARTN
jgi:hypothetical protein